MSLYQENAMSSFTLGPFKIDCMLSIKTFPKSYVQVARLRKNVCPQSTATFMATTT